MSAATHIRPAVRSDAEQVLGIYSPIVLKTATSFESEVPTVEEVRRRLDAAAEFAPWLVCERDGGMLGYAYAGKHRERSSYQWAVEVSVYVHERARRGGVGRALYASLLDCLAAQGFYTAYAVITLPNASSVGLHEALGFEPIGVFPKAGFKLGSWHDVGWWRLEIQPHAETPEAPKKLSEVIRSARWREALDRGESLLRSRSA